MIPALAVVEKNSKIVTGKFPNNRGLNEKN